VHVLHSELHVVAKFKFALAAVELEVLIDPGGVLREHLLDLVLVDELQQLNFQFLLLISLVSCHLQGVLGPPPYRALQLLLLLEELHLLDLNGGRDPTQFLNVLLVVSL
jgi:hypothetical protein